VQVQPVPGALHAVAIILKPYSLEEAPPLMNKTTNVDAETVREATFMELDEYTCKTVLHGTTPVAKYEDAEFNESQTYNLHVLSWTVLNLIVQ
jgi:hypothetical protein